jgi:hypothetical protein
MVDFRAEDVRTERVRTAGVRAEGIIRRTAHQRQSERRAGGSRHLLATLLASATLLLCGASIAASPASAATGHSFLSALTKAGASPLEEPAAVAIDRSDGHIFVSDRSAGVVDAYDSSGAFLAKLGAGSLFAAGVAVDEASGLVYVADSFENAVLVFKPNGSGGYEQIGEWDGSALAGEEFGEVSGIAVDNSKSPSSGDVYVVDGEDAKLSVGVVNVFRPKPAGPEEGEEGSLVRVLSKGAMEEPNGVAIDDSSGRVYIADSVKGAVYEYSATGELEGKMNGSSSPQGSFFGKEEEEGNVSAVAVDPGSGDLLVAESERAVVSEFNTAGQWVGWITSTPAATLAEPFGVAVASSGNVYVGNTGLARVDIFGPGAVVPDVSTEKASKPTRTTATLNATINGQGKAGHYFFQWGSTEELGSSTAPVAFSGPQEAVTAALSELQAGSTYFFRIVAENENGSSYGLVRELSTPTAVEKLSTGPVKDLQPQSATLTGSLTPNGFDAHYYFQWGTSTAYGNESPEPPGTDAGSEKGVVAAETAISGLSANTIYHYRLIATNSFGTTFGQDQQFTTSGAPRITSKPTTGIGHDTATLNATVNPDQLETAYRFQYGETTAYGAEAPSGGASAGAGATSVPVSAPLTALKLGVTYHFRVVAENSAGTTNGPDQTFTTIPPALITSYATNINSTEATLNTTVNPLGNETTYYFQYGTESCQTHPGACTSSPTPPGEDIGSGEEAVAKSLKLTGLTPDTTYHYRVLAINSLGESVGAERTLTTPKPVSSFALPDGRAFEMVSPPDKGSAPVEALTREGGIIRASEDGDRLTYLVDGALGENVEGNRSPEWQQVLATRGASWSSQDIATPSSKAKGLLVGTAPEYQYFNGDLSQALDEPAQHGPIAEPPLGPGSEQSTIYLRENIAGTFQPLVNETNTPPGTQYGAHVHFVAATPDLSHVLLTSSVALTGPGSAAGLYEWSGGALEYVSLLPDEVSPVATAELGFFGRVMSHAISDDGSRVLWTAPEGGVEVKRGHLYLRDTTRDETIKLDAAQGVAEPSKGSAQFQTASSDGSKVFFTDKQRLTADSTAEPGQGIGKPDLYECEIVEEAGKLACRLRDLTLDSHEGEHAFVANLIFGAGEDGSDLYLVAQGVLADNSNGNGETAQASKNNLYSLHYDGSQWARTFIATLSGDDSAQWEGNQVFDTAYLTARVSPNGRYLAFMSAASPTGYDNVEANPQAKGARDEEVYLYDSATAGLTCVSCNPTGERPSGVLDQSESGEGLGLLVDRRKVWAESGHEHWLAGNIPGWTAQTLTGALLQSRYLSDEGRLYFNSPDELVPAATNHKENVYQYEPSGVGSCESASGGCVALLSSGTSDRESAFIEATPSGSSVFLVTESNLLPQDTDTAFDIYDARACTAESPCQTIPEPPAGGCEEAQTCRPASPPQQIPGGPGGSATFSGPGNSQSAAQAQSQVKGKQASKPAAKPLTRKQKLAKALGLCKKKHAKKKRKACEAHARKFYGAKTAKKAVSHARGTAQDTNRRAGR